MFKLYLFVAGLLEALLAEGLPILGLLLVADLVAGFVALRAGGFL